MEPYHSSASSSAQSVLLFFFHRHSSLVNILHAYFFGNTQNKHLSASVHHPPPPLTLLLWTSGTWNSLQSSIGSLQASRPSPRTFPKPLRKELNGKTSPELVWTELAPEAFNAAAKACYSVHVQQMALAVKRLFHLIPGDLWPLPLCLFQSILGRLSIPSCLIYAKATRVLKGKKWSEKGYG